MVRTRWQPEERCRPTAIGSPTRPARPVSRRCTSYPSAADRGSGRSRRMEGRRRCGPPTAKAGGEQQQTGPAKPARAVTNQDQKKQGYSQPNHRRRAKGGQTREEPDARETAGEIGGISADWIFGRVQIRTNPLAERNHGRDYQKYKTSHEHSRSEERYEWRLAG